jgi:branched-chain amino acid transport system substrate-binding protein
MTTPRRTTRLTLGALCALSLFAAACGDDDDEDSATTAAEEATATAAESPETTAGESTETTSGESTDTTESDTTEAESAETTSGEDMGPATGEPIKIGMIYAETGRTASAYNTTNDVALAWTEYWNEHGGVGGRPVEVISIDMQGDVAVAAEAARELVETEGVVGVMIQDSATEIAVSQYFADAGVPVIGGTSNAFDAASAPNTQFVMASTAPGSYGVGLAAAAAAGGTHFSGIVCAEVPSCAAADPFYAANAEAFGLEYTPVVTATHTEPSYTSYCLAVTNEGQDVIVLGFAPAVVVPIAQECIAQGYTGQFSLSANTFDAAALDEAGNVDVVGYLNGFPWWADDPQVELYRTAMETSAPDVELRTPSGTNTWATLELFRKALTDTPPAADAVTTADVLAAYYALDGETLDGLLPGPVTFTEGDAAQPDMPCGWLTAYDAASGEFSTTAYEESGNGASGDLQSYCFVEG